VTIETTIAFFLAFLLLALLPGAGLAIILSRALGTGKESGMMSGLAVTTGLILGDFIFMGIALIGLSTLAQTMGPLFTVVKYCGAIYLIWLGLCMFLNETKPREIKARMGKNLLKDMAMGLFVTLGNPKPILFYGAFLPSFLDLKTVTLSDYFLMGLIIMLVSYVIYSIYIAITLRAKHLLVTSQAIKRLDQTAAVMFIGSGLWIAAR
jgi:threonine/homoserine/homoserine lactone efflux protein